MAVNMVLQFCTDIVKRWRYLWYLLCVIWPNNVYKESINNFTRHCDEDKITHTLVLASPWVEVRYCWTKTVSRSHSAANICTCLPPRHYFITSARFHFLHRGSGCRRPSTTAFVNSSCLIASVKYNLYMDSVCGHNHSYVLLWSQSGVTPASHAERWGSMN